MLQNDQIMTLDEASKYLKVHISTLYQLAQQRKIPVSKVGRLWRFRKHKIDTWLDNAENYKLIKLKKI